MPTGGLRAVDPERFCLVDGEGKGGRRGDILRLVRGEAGEEAAVLDLAGLVKGRLGNCMVLETVLVMLWPTKLYILPWRRNDR